MHRLDETLLALDASLIEARHDADSGKEAELRSKVDQREKILLPVYTSVAVHFADLHDTPARMRHVGVLRDVVPWPSARRFFHLRLRRRLLEFDQRQRLVDASRGTLTTATAQARLSNAYSSDDDLTVIDFLTSSSFQSLLDDVQTDALRSTVRNLAREGNPQSVATAVVEAAAENPEFRDALKTLLLRDDSA